MNIHVVNVVVGGIPADKRKKITVKMVLVLATDKQHALQEAAKGFSHWSNFDEFSFFYRNEFEREELPITWNFQTWDRNDFADVKLLTGAELLEGVQA